jgi:hypothetical protein
VGNLSVSVRSGVGVGTLLGPEKSGHHPGPDVLRDCSVGCPGVGFVFGLFGFWIVDASISNTGFDLVLLSLCSNFFVVRLLIGTRPAASLVVGFCCVGLCVWRQAMKGTWWMPWHQEPMKDVGACDKPWGVGNRAVIRGCPNGETQLESCPVTRA